MHGSSALIWFPAHLPAASASHVARPCTQHPLYLKTAAWTCAKALTSSTRQQLDFVRMTASHTRQACEGTAVRAGALTDHNIPMCVPVGAAFFLRDGLVQTTLEPADRAVACSRVRPRICNRSVLVY